MSTNQALARSASLLHRPLVASTGLQSTPTSRSVLDFVSGSGHSGKLWIILRCTFAWMSVSVTENIHTGWTTLSKKSIHNVVQTGGAVNVDGDGCIFLKMLRFLVSVSVSASVAYSKTRCDTALVEVLKAQLMNCQHHAMEAWRFLFGNYRIASSMTSRLKCWKNWHALRWMHHNTNLVSSRTRFPTRGATFLQDSKS